MAEQEVRQEKTALVVLAEGAEEMETVIAVDMLRRAGVNVTLAGLEGSSPVKCSRNVVIVPDKSLQAAMEAQPLYDCVLLPGGLGSAERLCKSDVVGRLLKAHDNDKRLIAAICAGPLALGAHNIGLGKEITAYPTVLKDMESKYKVRPTAQFVHDGNIITCPGPGLSFVFALVVIRELMGTEVVDRVRYMSFLKDII